jgi:HPt (histidine-containing phosphotransfer) domain-containing protein
MEWVKELIPDVAAKAEVFTVDTEEVDDELVEVFIDEIRRLTAEMMAGFEQRDGEAVRVAAHSIKGMGGTMGLPEISVLALEIEQSARDGELDQAARLIHPLAGWMETLG